MKKRLFQLMRLILILLFIVLLIKLIDFENLKNTLLKARIKYLIIAPLFTIPLFFLKSYKWHLLIKQSRKISYFESLKSYFAGYSVSIVSPIRGGDISRAFFVKGDSIQAGFYVLIDKMMDIIVICSYALIGIILFFPEYFIPLFVITFILILVTYNPWRVLGPALNFAARFKIFRKFTDKIEDYKTLRIGYKLSTVVLSLTFISYFISCLQFYVFLLSFDANALLKPVLLILPIVAISRAIPLKIVGDPVRILLLIFLFSLYGFSKEAVLSAGILSDFFSRQIIAVAGMPIASKRVYLWRKERNKIKITSQKSSRRKPATTF